MSIILPNLNRFTKKISLEDSLVNLQLNAYLKSHRTCTRDCLVHFLRLLAVCWPSPQVLETNTLLLVALPNIHLQKISLTNSAINLFYVATLPCNLSLMACFGDINVSQGSVATYARCGEMFNIQLTANLLRKLLVKKLNKSVKIRQNYGHESVAQFFLAHPV